MDRAGRHTRRLFTILQIYVSTQASPEWRKAAAELLPLKSEVDTQALTDPALFARVSAVYRNLPSGVSNSEQSRLAELTFRQMQEAGAGLSDAARKELAQVESELAALQAKFNSNLNTEAAGQFTFFDRADQLNGLPDPMLSAAAALAKDQGQPEKWAIPNARPQVFAVQTFVTDRATRKAVWTQWMDRGASAGELDNRPVTARTLELRARKAKLLGYATYADYVLATRMVATPRKALDLIEANWTAVMQADAVRIAELTQLARNDGVDKIEAWDRIYYLNRLTTERYGIDPQEIARYFPLEGIRDAIFAAAGDSFGYTFERLEGIPTVSPDIEVFLAKRKGIPAAIVYIDIHPRPGKQQGSWAMEYRPAGDLEANELPVVALHSSPPAAAPGSRILLPFEYANVLFHEFGHTLHTISSRARYRRTAALTVPWDFVEVPSLLNERWLLTDKTLDRLPHVQSGKPMSAQLRANLRAARQYERVFSVNPEFMAMALVDQKLHQATELPSDVNAFEAKVLADYGFPASADPVMRATAAVHTWSQQYAANVYTYLWSDILAADLAEVFLRAEGGFHDASVGARYFDHLLSRANTVPIDQAYREFHGRAPDENALMRRYGLQPSNRE